MVRKRIFPCPVLDIVNRANGFLLDLAVPNRQIQDMPQAFQVVLDGFGGVPFSYQFLFGLIGRDADGPGSFSGAKGLSASTMSRLKQAWGEEYAAWRQRPLGDEQWVYIWVDWIYSGLRAE